MVNERALLVVDMQRDFLPGGSLAVAEGDRIILTINSYVKLFQRCGSPVFASRDWHPTSTTHFKENGGKWPSHCVQNTPGAEFHPKLHLPDNTIILSKGMDEKNDEYSAFDGETSDGVTFQRVLKDLGVEELFICGVATDYCVRWSVKGALERGYVVQVLVDAIRPVELEHGDGARALEDMRASGVVEAMYSTVTEAFRVQTPV